jgi:hypothetical protein
MICRSSVGKEIEDLPLTISITMSVKEWREVASQQREQWPGWKIKSLIDCSIAKISKAVTVYTNGEEVVGSSFD